MSKFCLCRNLRDIFFPFLSKYNVINQGKYTMIVFVFFITDGHHLSTMSFDKVQKSKNEINGQQMWTFAVGFVVLV